MAFLSTKYAFFMSEPIQTKKKSWNKDLHNANKGKNDEFYTQLSDIEKEMGNYKEHLKGKIVFCNCDDPEESHFWKYFSENFEHLGLKKLISTHFEDDKPSYKLEIIADINGDGRINKLDTIRSPLKQNGDFRSPESIEMLEEADIVVTNPPFSLFREYVAQLFEYDKKFIIVGNQNAITYKDFFPFIQQNKVWFGHSIHSGDREFRVPDSYPLNASGSRTDEAGKKYIRVKWVRWFTNLDYKERHEDLILYKRYTPEEYPTYDNYDAINVNVTKDVPMDYTGYMWVPITFLDKYSPDQFEIIWQASGNTRASTPKEILERLGYQIHKEDRGGCSIVNWNRTYGRIIIKNKKL